jgi:hypothetical protein
LSLNLGAYVIYAADGGGLKNVWRLVLMTTVTA